MNEKLNEIKKENVIIIIYFILLFIYLYANSVEVNYIKYGDERDKNRYRLILYVVFGISFLITLYYVFNGVDSLNRECSDDVYRLNVLSLVANLMVLVATAIYLYIIYKDDNIDLEISP